jgi:pyrimidine-nucleoside phosphorylase
MRAVDIIVKKRDKGELSKEEIEFFVHGFVKDQIPDYQVSAWAMAVVLNGMTPRETTDLTLAMVLSGRILDLADVVDVAVDKHSTGGVGDKTTLVALPIVAACGLPVGKMSGRGLGFSGGTLDKMESIPGYRVDLDTNQFRQQLKEKGIVLSGQSADLTPADGKLYALRDVTGTVPSIPLIASSIMSKKIAAGAQAIVLDVKVGRGAFMKTVDTARELGELMERIGELAGRKVVYLLSDMNQPLGHAVGNALEVAEAVDALRGGGPSDLREHSLRLSSQMLVLGGRANSLEDGRSASERAIASGAAFEKFRVLVESQGGDPAYVDDPDRLPKATYVETVVSPWAGWVAQVDARQVADASVALGAGRSRKTDPIDHAVGLVVHHKVGDHVEQGEPLFTVHANNEQAGVEARQRVLKGHAFSNEPVAPLPHFYE